MNKESEKDDSRKKDAVGISRSPLQSRNDSDNRNAGKAELRLMKRVHIERSGGKRDGKADTMISTSTRSRPLDKDELVKRLVGICDPSTSLFRLHRYVFDVLKVEVPSTDLLQLLRSRNEFQIRMVHHALPADTLCVRNPSRPGTDDVHCKKDDPRLGSCTCRPGSSPLQVPCESWACAIPHAVIVSSSSMELHLDNTAPSSSPRQDMPVDLADIIVAAQAVYDDMYECP
uniref:Uncharacterized protein n=1 Tax=Hyaloperonospora arabidopsidis (strain Emoy2) TaxID=559515 RepID=M4B6L8_HYAAE